MSRTRRSRDQPPPPSAPRSAAPPRMPFGCIRSADAVYELYDRKSKIGRGPKCNIILTTSKSISSAHALILFHDDNNETILRDLNSTNGTFVNNVRVHNDTYPLETGDIIRFGCDIQSYRFGKSCMCMCMCVCSSRKSGLPWPYDSPLWNDTCSLKSYKTMKT